MKSYRIVPLIFSWIVLLLAIRNSTLAFAPQNFHPRRCSPTTTVQEQRVSATSEFSASEDAERLKEQARKLREEIESFQEEKDSLEENERLEIQAELDARQAIIDQYSAVVPILKPDGSTVEEQVQFPSRFPNNESRILVLEAPLPLGMILGEHETIPGMTAVDDIADGSNGQLAGFQLGDLIRACTACRVEMEQPMWQIMAGGIGRPKTMRFIYSTDFKPFEQVMDALGSNRMDPEERSVLMVVERLAKV